MPDVSAVDFERMRNGGQISSVRVQPAGTRVDGYQVNLGNRPSQRDIGVVGAPAWTAEQTETWTRTSVSATCPRRLVVFEGGKKDVTRCMEFGDDFDGGALNAAKWSVTGTPAVSGGSISLPASAKIISTWAGGQNLAVRTRVKLSAGNYSNIGFTDASDRAVRFIYGYPRAGVFQAANGDPATETAAGVQVSDLSGAYSTLEAIRNGSTNTLFYINSVLSATISLHMTANALSVVFGSGSGGASLCDYVCVKKYTPNEPVAGTAQPSALNRSMCQSLNLADGLRACCVTAA